MSGFEIVAPTRLTFTADGKAVYRLVTESSPAVHQSTATATAIAGEDSGDLNRNVVKKKRGRPRKHGLDGSMALPLSPAPPAGGFASPVPAPATATASALKKSRGRPLGSSNKQKKKALGSAGAGFTVHVIHVNAGEDVSSKIMAFSQNSPRAVCVLSCDGVISNVTLRQAATSGGTATYEGRFDLVSLCGSFLLSEIDGQWGRTGGLSVTLAGPDGRILGGSVAGLLTAASLVQVILGSFMVEGGKEPKEDGVNQTKPLAAVAPPTEASSPGSHGGTLSESSGAGGGGGGGNNYNSNSMSEMAWN